MYDLLPRIYPLTVLEIKRHLQKQIKRIYLQLVESASFMIYKLLISNQSLILLLVHLRLHTVLIIPRLDIKMGIVSYFLFIGYNINLHTCTNACAYTHIVHLWKSTIRLCYHWKYSVPKVNTSSVHYFCKVFFGRTGSHISVNLRLIVPRFCCFWRNKKVLRDALLTGGGKSAFFHLENIGMLQLILKANLKTVKRCTLVGILKVAYTVCKFKTHSF